MWQVDGNTIDLNLAETSVFIPTTNTYDDGSTDTVLLHDRYSNVTIHHDRVEADDDEHDGDFLNSSKTIWRRNSGGMVKRLEPFLRVDVGHARAELARVESGPVEAEVLRRERLHARGAAGDLLERGDERVEDVGT
jgi:hypothetical protein